MNCLFCGDPRLTKEHVVSKPVAQAFRLDRSQSFGRFPYDVADSSDLTWSRLDDLRVRLVCKACNENWMNALEHEMARAGRHLLQRRSRLGTQHNAAIRAWMLKTYLVLSAIEGGIRRFAHEGEVEFAVIPEVTRARQLQSRDEAAFEGAAFGIARTGEQRRFGYGFGNPRVLPSGPGYASTRSAGSAAVSLGEIQLWIVVPFFRHAQCRLPQGVSTLSARTDLRRLVTLPFVPNTGLAVVDNGEHDIVEFVSALERLSGEAST